MAESQLYTITVYTSNIPKAGTNANVYIILYGTRGSTDKLDLNNEKNNHERGAVDSYSFTLEDLGNIKAIKIGHDNSGKQPGWHLAEVHVRNDDTNETWIFPCHSWLATTAGERKVYKVLDGR